MNQNRIKCATLLPSLQIYSGNDSTASILNFWIMQVKIWAIIYYFVIILDLLEPKRKIDLEDEYSSKVPILAAASENHAEEAKEMAIFVQLTIFISWKI